MTVTDADLFQLQVRVAELERKIDHILRFANDVPPVPAKDLSLSPQVQELMTAGNLIGAIKAYREETGVDLATAKAMVQGGS